MRTLSWRLTALCMLGFCACGCHCIARCPLELTLARYDEAIRASGASRIRWLDLGLNCSPADVHTGQSKGPVEEIQDIPLAVLLKNVSSCTVLIDKELFLGSTGIGLKLDEVTDYFLELAKNPAATCPDIPGEDLFLRPVPRWDPSIPPIGEIVSLRPGGILGIRFTLGRDAGLRDGTRLQGKHYGVFCSYHMTPVRAFYYRGTAPDIWVGLVEAEPLMLP